MLNPEPMFPSMSTNSSDPQKLSTLDYHTSLNDGTSNNESAVMHSNFTRYVEPQWAERSQTNSMIFLVLVALWWVFKRVEANGIRNESTNTFCQIFIPSFVGEVCWSCCSKLLVGRVHNKNPRDEYPGFGSPVSMEATKKSKPKNT